MAFNSTDASMFSKRRPGSPFLVIFQTIIGLNAFRKTSSIRVEHRTVKAAKFLNCEPPQLVLDAGKAMQNSADNKPK
jgi:hypothetical protein